MRSREELPYRYWHEFDLPEGVKVWPKVVNLKTAEFAKVYVKQVSPTLRGLGFKCAGMRGRGVAGRLLRLSCFSGGGAGGYGYLSFAAHPVGLPTRDHGEQATEAFDLQHCVFVRDLRLYAGQWGERIDLGKDVADAEEASRYLLEMIAEQAVPWLEGLPGALEVLETLPVEEFAARMPELVRLHSIRVGYGQDPDARRAVYLAVLLGRLAAMAGRHEAAAAWGRFGRERLAETDLTGYPLHLQEILLEKLIAGDPVLHFGAADRLEHERRMAATRAADG